MPADSMRKVLIGIGNEYRGDDGAGIQVARRLKMSGSDGVAVVEHDGEPAALIETLKDADSAVLVDAAAGPDPGRIHRFDAAAGELPRGIFGWSTHGMSVAEAIELARTLGELPARCIVYAVEGQSFETGAPLSVPVEMALAELERRARADLRLDEPATEGAADA